MVDSVPHYSSQSIFAMANFVDKYSCHHDFSGELNELVGTPLLFLPAVSENNVLENKSEN